MLRATALLALVPSVHAQSFEVASLDSAGNPGDWDGFGGWVSADGRFVAFSSYASTFFPNDLPSQIGNPDDDVFLRDRATGATIHVSAGHDSAHAAGIAADGSCVLYWTFESTTSGLLYARGRVWDRASATSSAVSAAEFESTPKSVSADGRYVTFLGRDVSNPNPNLWPVPQAYVVDRLLGVTTLVSRTPAGLAGDARSHDAAICADGSRIVFSSDASDLGAAPQGETHSDVYLFDVASGAVSLVSRTPSGASGDRDSYVASISADGRYAGFFSLASDLVAGDANFASDLFRADLATGTIVRVSVANDGAEVFSSYNQVALSGDGRFAFFSANGSTFVAGDTGPGFDVFVRDVQLGTTRRLSLAPGGVEPNNDCWFSHVSPDGRYVAFGGYVSNLVPADSNGVSDAFLLDLGAGGSVAAYCAALPNSTGQSARIGWSGFPSLVTSAFALSCAGLPASTLGRFVVGTQAVDPGVPFGNGLACVAGTVVALPVVRAQGGAVEQPVDLAGAAFAGVLPGSTRHAQFVFRNPAGGGAGFHTSDAARITFSP